LEVAAYFSHGINSILREEGEADVFAVRRWGEADQDSESEEETMIDTSSD